MDNENNAKTIHGLIMSKYRERALTQNDVINLLEGYGLKKEKFIDELSKNIMSLARDGLLTQDYISDVLKDIDDGLPRPKFKMLDDVRIRSNTKVKLPIHPGASIYVTAVAGSTVEVKYEYGNEVEYHEIDERYLSSMEPPERIYSMKDLGIEMKSLESEMGFSDFKDMDYIRDDDTLQAINNVFKNNSVDAFSADESDLFGMIADEFVNISRETAEKNNFKSFDEKYCRAFFAEEASAVISQAMAYRNNHFAQKDIQEDMGKSIEEAISLMREDEKVIASDSNMAIIFDNFDEYNDSKVPEMEEGMANKRLGAISKDLLEKFAHVPGDIAGFVSVDWNSLKDIERLYVLSVLKPGFTESRATNYPDREMASTIEALEGFEDKDFYNKYSVMIDFYKEFQKDSNSLISVKLAKKLVDLYGYSEGKANKRQLTKNSRNAPSK